MEKTFKRFIYRDFNEIVPICNEGVKTTTNGTKIKTYTRMFFNKRTEKISSGIYGYMFFEDLTQNEIDEELKQYDLKYKLLLIKEGFDIKISDEEILNYTKLKYKISK
jgi:hypothetical protein